MKVEPPALLLVVAGYTRNQWEQAWKLLHK